MFFSVSISVEVYGPSVTTLSSLPDFYVIYFHRFGTALGVHFRHWQLNACPELLVVWQLEHILIWEAQRPEDGGLTRQRKAWNDCSHPWHQHRHLQSHSLRTCLCLCYLPSPTPCISLELPKKNISFPAFLTSPCSFIPHHSCAKPDSCVSASRERRS